MKWEIDTLSGEVTDTATGKLICTLALMQLKHHVLIQSAPELLELAKEYRDLYEEFQDAAPDLYDPTKALEMDMLIFGCK